MNNKLFKNIGIKDIFLIAIVFFSGFSYPFFLIDRLGFWRLIYPLQAQFAIWNIECPENAPKWMNKSLKYIIINQKMLSNQLVYIDHNNQIYTCQSGWQKTTVFSKPILKNTRFRYASMTKLITNDAVIKLINQRKIKLDYKIVDYFDELKGQSFKDERIKEITIADLLQQRSGFDRMKSEDVVFSTNKKPWCPTQLKKLLEIELDFEPNTRYAYDNRNTCLLGVVIERVTRKNYREYIERQYQISKYNIKFIDGVYYSDEVRYDFRNSDFWMESDDNSFDFYAVSSSAGLSGSAESLARIIKSMLKQHPLNILDIAQNNFKTCNLNEFQSCNGYAMWQYQKDKQSLKMYFRNGGLPAATSLAIVTAKQEVIVWTSNGAKLYNEDFDNNLIEKYFYKILTYEN